MPVDFPPARIPWVNVLDYGAVGDNTHDDAPNAQLAHDAAGPYGFVLYPPGLQYKFGHMVVPYSHQYVELQGARINLTGSGTLVAAFYHQNTVSTPTVKRAISGAVFHGGTITETGGGQGASGIQLGSTADAATYSDHCLLDHVEAVGCNLDLQGGDGNQAVRCYVHNSTQTNAPAIRLSAPANGDNSVTNGKYLAIANTIVTYGSIGISAVGNVASVIDNTILDAGQNTNCFAVDCGNAQNLTVSGNRIRGYWGVLSENAVGHARVTIQRNLIWFEGTLTAGQKSNAAILVHRTNLTLTILDLAVVTENVIDGGPNNTWQGVQFNDIGGVICERNTIDNVVGSPILVFVNAAGGGVDANPCSVQFNTCREWSIGTDGANSEGIFNQSKNAKIRFNTLFVTTANGSQGIHCQGANPTGSTVVIENNDIRGTATALNPATGNIVRRNTGQVGTLTENSGTATIAATGTSIVVTHGLYATPTRVLISVTADPGLAERFWVDTYTSTQFTIHASAAVTNSTSFDWAAFVGEGF